jgi:hypothetical protein
MDTDNLRRFTTKRIFLIISIFLLAACSTNQYPNTNTSPPADPTISFPDVKPSTAIPLSGADKWALWTGKTRLRGANLHPCKLFEGDKCLEEITLADIQDLRNLGANVINATYPGVFNVDPPYTLNETAVNYLDDLVAWAGEVGIYVIINVRSGPGRNEAAIHMAKGGDFSIWEDRAAQEAWIEMWRYIAERYQDNPVVIGYNLLTEPHPNILVAPDGNMEPEDAYAEMEGTLMDWNIFAKEITAAIREVDKETPIIIDSLNWADAAWFSVLEPTGDSHTVYSPHIYDPDVYTIQEPDEIEIIYPSVVEYYGEEVLFNKDWLTERLSPVVKFSETYNVPVFVGEFGVLRWVPGAGQYILDLITLFEDYGWGYAYYTWRGDEPYFDGFNMEYGTHPENHTRVDNPLLEVFTVYWAYNVDYP